ncbi:hypothetical protein [Chlorobium ferrooxidans]|uniref:Uncharacterized protein n=1 Tax=Chlorobium ferrooxidans DSM 13031 TaxID=377431 RepID=Q0YT22_9CHLB|nr:hypothetical protein [Chlorobium ferrooxidans]EAT59442.1 conserved hypothetical protein [Chlorobium ferrooxidans DSM 13031]
MDLIDLIPFQNEFNKTYHGLTSNATHTSEKPVFHELKVRRYDKPVDEIRDFISGKIDHWVGWELKSEKTAVGGTTTIRGEVTSVLLFGMKIDVTFGLFEETDINGRPITTINAKAETRIESRGDLGESRRIIRMMLGALDFEFRHQQIKDEDYHYRSVDVNGPSASFQQIFDNARLQHQKKPEGSPKATAIEFKKRAPVQTIQLNKPAEKNGDTSHSAGSAAENGSSSAQSETPASAGKAVASRPKVTIITTKKNI